LLDTPVLDGDLAVERRRDAEDDHTFDLRPDGVGIDDGAAIDRADDPADAAVSSSLCSRGAGLAEPTSLSARKLIGLLL
jgi:hypothetical protein